MSNIFKTTNYAYILLNINKIFKTCSFASSGTFPIETICGFASLCTNCQHLTNNRPSTEIKAYLFLISFKTGLTLNINYNLQHTYHFHFNNCLQKCNSELPLTSQKPSLNNSRSSLNPVDIFITMCAVHTSKTHIAKTQHPHKLDPIRSNLWGCYATHILPLIKKFSFNYIPLTGTSRYLTLTKLILFFIIIFFHPS